MGNDSYVPGTRASERQLGANELNSFGNRSGNITGMVPVLTALIGALAAFGGYLTGYFVEVHRSSEARKARLEERDWQRSERKRQALTELQQALGQHVVMVVDASYARSAIYRPGETWPRAGKFNREGYESQIRAAFLATRTGDEEVLRASDAVVAAAAPVLEAATPAEAERAMDLLAATLNKADILIFQRLKAAE